MLEDRLRFVNVSNPAFSRHISRIDPRARGTVLLQYYYSITIYIPPYTVRHKGGVLPPLPP